MYGRVRHRLYVGKRLYASQASGAAKPTSSDLRPAPLGYPEAARVFVGRGASEGVQGGNSLQTQDPKGQFGLDTPRCVGLDHPEHCRRASNSLPDFCI
jgi:hypothetical protein